MSSIFNDLRIYADSWKVVKTDSLSEEDIKLVSSIKIVDSNYGPSACFLLKAGGLCFIPLSNTCSLQPGETVNDLSSVEIVTLQRAGSQPIKRLQLKPF